MIPQPQIIKIMAPHIRNTLIDPECNVIYHVMAYRKLSDDELEQRVRIYLSRGKNRKRRVERNKEIEIQTVIGFLPGR